MLITALFIASISASTATIETAPYSAYEIDADQTIKMRVNPILDAPVVAEIPGTATDIVLTGSFGGHWTNVRYHDQTGWVRDSDIGLGTPGRFQIPTRIDCTANDAAWSFHLGPAIALFRRAKESHILVVTGVHEDPAELDRLTVTLRSPSQEMVLPVVFERADKHAINVAIATGSDTSAGTCHRN